MPKSSTAHPLVKSSVFHYEFEFIHPFLDGNGRMGRILETIRQKGTPVDVPINVPINVPITERVLALVRAKAGISRPKMAVQLSVDVKTIARALAKLPQIEHRGSKRTGGYYLRKQK